MELIVTSEDASPVMEIEKDPEPSAETVACEPQKPGAERDGLVDDIRAALAVRLSDAPCSRLKKMLAALAGPD